VSPSREATRDHFDDLEGSTHRDAVNRLAAGHPHAARAPGRQRQRVDRAEMAEHTAAALRFAGRAEADGARLLPRRRGPRRRAGDQRPRPRRGRGRSGPGGVRPHLAAAPRPDGDVPRACARPDRQRRVRARGTAREAPSRPLLGGVAGRRGATGHGWAPAGTITRYTVEIADGLESRQDVHTFRRIVESTLSDPDRGLDDPRGAPRPAGGAGGRRPGPGRAGSNQRRSTGCAAQQG
jgi:hypothetical protein